MTSLMVLIHGFLFSCRVGTSVDLEAEFKPNLLNTTVYIISVAMQISTFAVNYKVSVGHLSVISAKEYPINGYYSYILHKPQFTINAI